MRNHSAARDILDVNGSSHADESVGLLYLCAVVGLLIACVACDCFPLLRAGGCILFKGTIVFILGIISFRSAKSSTARKADRMGADQAPETGSSRTPSMDHSQDSASKSPSPESVSCFHLFAIFFRIGLMTFGGGFAMSTVLRHEMVLKRKWLSEGEFYNALSTATSVPGPVAVNLAFIEGSRFRGLRGGLSAVLGQVCPSVIVILLLVRYVAPYFDHPQLAAFLKGCAVAVAAQIAFAAFTFAGKLRRHWQNAVVCGLGLLILGIGLHPVFAVLAAGAAGYLLMRERMAKREWTDQQEAELLGHIERIGSPELVYGSLDEKARNTILKRHELVRGRFEAMIEGCTVLDLEQAMGVEDFLDLAADKLATRLDMDAAHLAAVLRKREEEGGTVLNDWLAVPHAIVEGDGVFQILIARARGGVRFSAKASNVQTIFVLVGSADERDFYLCALAAIAQVAGNEEFRKQWLRARTARELKIVVLLQKQLKML
jgi:chromate transporter